MDIMNIPPQAEVEKAEETRDIFLDTLKDVIDLGDGVSQAIRDEEEREKEAEIEAQQNGEKTTE